MRSDRSDRTILVGITGNSGCGQTTAAGFASAYCSGVCSLDETGHRLLERQYVLSDLVMRYCMPELSELRGDDLRSVLRDIVFDDPHEMEKLNSVVHPRMKRWAISSAARLRNGADNGIWVLEGALIYELGLDALLDLVIVVSDTPERCARRISVRDGISTGEALKRWSFQMSLAEKEAACDIVITNQGSEDDMGRAIRSIFVRM